MIAGKFSSFIAIGAVVGLLGLFGCHAETGTVSHEPIGYLKFFNGKKGESAEIDFSQSIALLNDDDTEPVPVAPGKHRVVVRRADTVLMDREILVSDLQTLELKIP